MNKDPNKQLGTDLTQLSTMLKKRGNKSFQEDLRNKLLNQAKTMNAQKKPKKEQGLSWNFGSFFLKGLVPVTATLLIAIFAVYTFLPRGGTGPQVFSLVDIASAKDYYTLSPTDSDTSGVDEETEFILAGKGEISVKDVEKNLKVTPETEFKMTQKNENEVVIKPLSSLEPGEVYAFTLEAENIENSPYKKEFNWAYQVSEQLRVTGTIPGRQSTGVPINSGIEVRFNYRGITADDFQKNFKIEPSVKGTFEINEKTAIFAPSALQEGTIYTVAISKDIHIDGSEKTLGEDYTFQFETSQSTKSVTSLDFTENILENSLDSNPVFEIYHREEGVESVGTPINITVYKFKDSGQLLNAMEEMDRAAPWWCFITRSNYKIPTKDLEKITEASDQPIFEVDFSEYVELPEKLAQGYYLVEISRNDASDQAVLQVTDTSVFINLNSSKPFVWVNDLSTGKPIEGASVSIEKYNLNSKTNSDGLAVMDSFESDNEWDYNANKNPTLVKITANGKDTFYYTSDWKPSINDKWTYIRTDRPVYLPTDTINFWGFVQGKKTPINGKAKVAVRDSYWYAYESDDSVKHYYEQEVDIKDGNMFSGQIEIEKLSPGEWNFGYYEIEIYTEDEHIASTSFGISEYIKPAYDIGIEAEKNVLLPGGKTNVNVSAKFFEGTPVPDIPIRYYNGKSTVEAETDEQGKFSFTYESIINNCEEFSATSLDAVRYYGCSLFSTRTLNAAPRKEELADIIGYTRVTTARSTVGASNLDFDFDSLSLQTKKVDFDKVADMGYPWENESIFSAPAPESKIEYTIFRLDTIKTETGEYYDYVDKVVKKKYDYDTKSVQVTSDSKVTGPDGNLNIPLNLDKNNRYKLYIKIFDPEGRFYAKTRTIGYRTWGYQDYSLEGIEYDAKYDIGDKIFATVVDQSGEPAETNDINRYLFLWGQTGSTDLKLQNSPKFEIEFKKEFIPNIDITAIAFNGRTYWRVYQKQAVFNSETRRLDVELQTTKEKYEPGEEVTMKIKVKEKDSGKGVKADVSLNLVDEAYYALYSESFSDPLQIIYSPVRTDFGYSYGSHYVEAIAMAEQGGCFIEGTKILMADGTEKNIEDIETGDYVLTRTHSVDAELVPARVMKTYKHNVEGYLLINGALGVTREHVIFVNGKWQLAGDIKVGDILLNSSDEPVTVNSIEFVEDAVRVYNFEVEKNHTYFANDIYVHNDKGGAREDFQDTALFTVVSTNSDGTAEVKFELPDNITTWRVTAAAIKGGEIMAGYSSSKVVASKPLFALPVISPEYLTGDIPKIPVRAYGDALKQGMTIAFQMASEGLNFKESAEGKAFSPTYFALPELTPGEYKISSTAKAENNSDTIILPIEVKDSHMTQWLSWDEILKDGMKIKGSSQYRTEVIFSNHEAGQVLGVLYAAAYGKTNRADLAAASHVAKKWLNEKFGYNFTIDDFETFTYQQIEEDGISLLPYSDPDLKLTALLINLDKDLWGYKSTINYFLSHLNNPDLTVTEKIAAIYGLTGAGEKYLTDLNYFVDNFDLSVEDKVFAALAYSNMGAENLASDLYLEILKETEKTAEGGLKVKAEGIDSEVSLTALTAQLGVEIGDSKSDDLWTHVRRNCCESKDILATEQMLYIKSKIESGIKSRVSFNINGKTVTLENWDIYNINVLPEDLAATNISSVDGEVSVFSYYREPADISSFTPDSRIKIERTYKVNGAAANTFKPGDLVEIRFKVTVPPELGGSYQVRDYLPSGLQTTAQASNNIGRMDKLYRYPFKVDKQELTFYMYCGDEKSKAEARCTSGKEFYYIGRVINKGTFIAEPAILQSFENDALLNLSQKDKTSIEIK
jgi:hypothetical protein